MTEQTKSIGMDSQMAVSQFAANAPEKGENWSVGFNSRTAIAGLLFCAGYYLGAKIGFALTFQPHAVSVLWPPNSILLAALLLTPVRAWWFLLLAALPAHLAAELQSNVPPSMVLCWFISNCCEALIGAGTTRYLMGGPARLDRLRRVAIFCLCAALLGPFVSSFVDAGFVRLNDWGQGGYWDIWRIRFTSNVLAVLTIAPVIVACASGGMASVLKTTRWRHVEAGLLFLGLLTVTFVVLWKVRSASDPALLYAPLPFLLWAAVRFGSWGASTAVLTVAFLAIWSAAHRHGPFSENSPAQNALSVQMFLIVMSIPLMFLAAVIEERRTVGERFVKAFRSSPDAMVISRLKDGHIIEVNERCETLFGYRREEAIGRTIFDLNIFAREADRERLIAGTSSGGVLHDLELCLRTKTGELRQILISADTEDMGEERCLILILRDITDRKRMEAEAARGRVELAHATRVFTIGAMAGSLAHELNQPLTSILSNAQAGSRFLSGPTPNVAEVREVLQDIAQDTKRAGAVIRQLRTLVKKEELRFDQFKINRLIQDVVRLVCRVPLLQTHTATRNQQIEPRKHTTMTVINARIMKTTIRSSLFLGTVLGAALAFNALAQETKPTASKPLSAERTILVTVTAKVEAIDQAKREVRLKGPLGNVVTFLVDERVKRLNEVRVGDEVTADYYVSLAGELRAPTEEEKKTPLTILAGAARAPKGTSPAGGVLRAFKVVAMVIGLDLPTQSVTLQGPLGNTGTIRAEHVENLKQLRLGDTVVVTYTEALAISMQKAQHAGKKE